MNIIKGKINDAELLFLEGRMDSSSAKEVTSKIKNVSDLWLLAKMVKDTKISLDTV